MKKIKIKKRTKKTNIKSNDKNGPIATRTIYIILYVLIR